MSHTFDIAAEKARRSREAKFKVETKPVMEPFPFKQDEMRELRVSFDGDRFQGFEVTAHEAQRIIEVLEPLAATAGPLPPHYFEEVSKKMCPKCKGGGRASGGSTSAKCKECGGVGTIPAVKP